MLRELIGTAAAREQGDGMYHQDVAGFSGDAAVELSSGCTVPNSFLYGTLRRACDKTRRRCVPAHGTPTISPLHGRDRSASGRATAFAGRQARPEPSDASRKPGITASRSMNKYANRRAPGWRNALDPGLIMRIFRFTIMRIPMPRSAKKPRNLTLDDDAMSRGERYSREHGTSISRLVGDFLRTLPIEPARGALSPAVRRLLGVAAGRSVDEAAYRTHLVRKYGGRQE